MSSSGLKSPGDAPPVRGRYSQRRGQNSIQGTSSLLPATLNPPVDGRNPTETESRSSTPELPSLDATISVPSAHEDPLPFPTRSTWRNLSIIFEASESTNSLSNEDALPTRAITPVPRSAEVEQLASAKEKRRYSLPIISSLAPKSTKTTVAEMIAYFEKATSPRPNSFLPVAANGSRRRSLPSTSNGRSTPSSVSSPAKSSHTDANLGNILHKGFLWYLNVHGPGPPKWIPCKASLYRSALVLTWQTTTGKTTAKVALDLTTCLDVHSTRTVSDPSAADDVGAIAWGRDRDRGHDSVEDIYPIHLRWNDGVERIAASTLHDRLAWVGTILEFLPLKPSRQGASIPPRRQTLSPLPRSTSTPANVPLINESRYIIEPPAKIPSPTFPRPTSGHTRTRSTGDVPKRLTSAMEYPRSPFLRRISSMSNMAFRDPSIMPEFGQGTTTTGSSPISSISSRRRSVSLKGLASLLSGRSSRVDNLTSTEGSKPVNPTATRSGTLLSRSSSRESALMVSEDTEGVALGHLMRKRNASAGSRLRKPDPRLPALARRITDPHRSISDGQIPKKLRENVSSSLMMEPPMDYSPSSPPYYQSATASLPPSPAYYTASEGDAGDSRVLQGNISASSSTPGDSIFVTASDFTSSDAWMAHLTAASHPTPPPVTSPPFSSPSSRFASPQTSAYTLNHLFDDNSTPQPAIIAGFIPSPIFTRLNDDLARPTAAFSVQSAVAPTDTTLGDVTTYTSVRQTSVLEIDKASIGITDESIDYPGAPPPSFEASPYTPFLLFGEVTSSLHNNPASSTHAPIFTTSMLPDSPGRTSSNDIFTQLEFTSSLQNITEVPGRFVSMRHGDIEYEVTRVGSTSPDSSDVTPGPIPLLQSAAPSRRRVVPKKAISRMASTASMNSSIFLPSRQPSTRSIVPKTPSTVEVSLTPIQASVFPSPGITTSSFLDRSHQGFLEEESCEERVKNLLEFVEHTRASQTTTSGEFSEQLGRIEGQLAELGHLVGERMRTLLRDVNGIDQPATGGAERLHNFARLPPVPSGSRSPTILFLSPSPSAVHEEITPTSAELPNTITQTDISNGTNTLPGLEAPNLEGDTSSSLHLPQFPDVPHPALSIGPSVYSTGYVSNAQLRDMIERLAGSIETLVTRQQMSNGTLEGLRRRGVTLGQSSPPNDMAVATSLENISPRWINLLRNLERFARRGSHPDERSDDFQHFPDPSVNWTSPSSVGHTEILRAHPVNTDAIALASAHRRPAPRKRSHSHIGTILTSSDEFSSPRERCPRAKSLGTIQIMADVPAAQETPDTNAEETISDDTLGPLVGVPLVPRQRAPITRTWYRKVKGKKMHVHWSTPSEAGTGNEIPKSERGTGSEGDSQVTRLLQACSTKVYAQTALTLLMKKSRLQQEAATIQQNEIVRYLGELNNWLARDAVDRRTELRGLGDRLDGIQRVMMYGPTPAVSFAVPSGPLPIFTPPSEQSSDHVGWFIVHGDDDSTIIPPTPQRSREISTSTPINPSIKMSEATKNAPPAPLPVLKRNAERKEGPTVVVEGLSNYPRSTNTRQSGGHTVTFQALRQVQGLPDGDPSSISRVLDDTVTIPSRTFDVAREDARDHQAYHDEKGSRSRSRAVKPLTPEEYEILVNIPSADEQRARDHNSRINAAEHSQLSARGHDRRTDSPSLRVNDAGDTPREVSGPRAQSDHAYNGWGPPDETGWRVPYKAGSWGGCDDAEISGAVGSWEPPEGWGAAWGLTASHETPRLASPRDRSHTIMPKYRAIERTQSSDDGKTGHTRHSARRPSPLSRHSRRCSKSPRRPENLAREASTSENETRGVGPHHPDIVTVRRSSSSPEPSNRRRYRSRENRASPSKGPQRASIHRMPSPRSGNHKAHRNSQSEITTSSRVHQRHLLPTVLTGLDVSDTHRSDTHGGTGDHHALGGLETSIHPKNSPRSLQRHIPTTSDLQRDRHSEARAQTAPGADLSSNLLKPGKEVMCVPGNPRGASVKAPGRTAYPATFQSGSRELAVHVDSLKHPQTDFPGFTTRYQISEPCGAYSQCSSEDSVNPPDQATSFPGRSKRMRAGSLKNVGYSMSLSAEDHSIPEKESAPTMPLQRNISKIKKASKGKKDAEKRLSVISEKSEPQIPFPAGVVFPTSSTQGPNEMAPGISEQARDTIFLARQAERQRMLNEDAHAQNLAQERLLSGRDDSTLANAHRVHDGDAYQSPLHKHTREPARTTFSPSNHGREASFRGKDAITLPSVELPSERGHLDSTILQSVPVHLDVPSSSSRPTLVTTARGKYTEVVRSTRPSSQVTRGADHIAVAESLLHSLREEATFPETLDKYSQELAYEREKARSLEDEIRKTRDAVQAIRDERAAANEKRCLDTLGTISQMQTDMQSQLRSITGQLAQFKNKGAERRQTAGEEVLDPSMDDGVSGLVSQILEGLIAERHLRLEQRSAVDSQLTLEVEIEQLRQQNEAQKVLIEDMLGKTTKQNRKQQALLLEAFKKASTEQIKANVTEHLHEFTGAMTHEVRILLKEVGNLREQRRNLQHEIGCLLCFRSKMEPGGEFDPSWDPSQETPCTHGPPVAVPLPEAPAFAGTMPPVVSRVWGVPSASTSKKHPAGGNATQASLPGTAGNHNASSAHPTSPPPPLALPRPSNRGTQPPEPSITAPQSGSGQNTPSQPAPLRATRKSRAKRAQ